MKTAEKSRHYGRTRKRSSSTFKVKYNLNCPEKAKKVFSVCSGSSGNMKRHLKVNIVLVYNIFM
jgi:hypothetical protein